MNRALPCVLGVMLVAVAGCVPSGTPAPRTSVRTIVRTVTRSQPPPPSFTPAAPTSVAPLPPGASPAHGEVERACAYIVSSPGGGGPSVADIIGSHVYRTTVLRSTTPVGCRFYFYAPPYEAIADIVPRRFPTARDAYAAMVATGEAGGDASGRPGIVPGVDGVLYRTRFFGGDGARDWACVFAAGRTMVIVHSQRDDTSFSALRLAKAVAGKF